MDTDKIKIYGARVKVESFEAVSFSLTESSASRQPTQDHTQTDRERVEENECVVLCCVVLCVCVVCVRCKPLRRPRRTR